MTHQYTRQHSRSWYADKIARNRNLVRRHRRRIRNRSSEFQLKDATHDRRCTSVVIGPECYSHSVDSRIECKLTSERRGYLATSDENHPHIVPVVFVYVDGTLHLPIDGKPKASKNLKRLRNIRKNPSVCFLLDEYDEDWTRLWWLRLDCSARVEPIEASIASLLREKYPNYRDVKIGEEMISLKIVSSRFWSMS